MRAVAAVTVDGVAVCVMIAVIELERDLGAVIQCGRAHTRDVLFAAQVVLFQHLLDVGLREARVLRRGRKQLVIQIDAGVKNGDNRTLACVARGVVHTAADHLVAGGHARLQLKGRRDERRLDTVQLADFLQLGIGHVSREAVCQRAIAVPHAERGAAEHLLRDLPLHSLLCAEHPGLRGSGRPPALRDLRFVQKDNHTDDLLGIDLVFFLFKGLGRGFVRAEEGAGDLSAGRFFRSGFHWLRGEGRGGQKRNQKR